MNVSEAIFERIAKETDTVYVVPGGGAQTLAPGDDDSQALQFRPSGQQPVQYDGDKVYDMNTVGIDEIS